MALFLTKVSSKSPASRETAALVYKKIRTHLSGACSKPQNRTPVAGSIDHFGSKKNGPQGMRPVKIHH